MHSGCGEALPQLAKPLLMRQLSEWQTTAPPDLVPLLATLSAAYRAGQISAEQKVAIKTMLLGGAQGRAAASSTMQSLLVVAPAETSRRADWLDTSVQARTWNELPADLVMAVTAFSGMVAPCGNSPGFAAAGTCCAV